MRSAGAERLGRRRERRLDADLPGWTTCGAPEGGDLEVSFESSYALEGAVFARHMAFELTALESG
jgi:hypothetical protein